MKQTAKTQSIIVRIVTRCLEFKKNSTNEKKHIYVISQQPLCYEKQTQFLLLIKTARFKFNL